MRCFVFSCFALSPSLSSWTVRDISVCVSCEFSKLAFRAINPDSTFASKSMFDDDENFLPLSFLSHLFLHHSSPHAQKTHRIPARFPQYAWGMYDDSFVEVPDPEEEKKWREDCAKYVAETLLPILDQRGNVTYKLDIIAYEMNNTSIGEVVCEKAKIIDADLVVMASHRKGRLQEFFVGSVTNYCLHHSKVPLLVYKEPKETDINTKYYTGDISKKEKEASPSRKETKEGKTTSIDFEKATLQEG